MYARLKPAVRMVVRRTLYMLHVHIVVEFRCWERVVSFCLSVNVSPVWGGLPGHVESVVCPGAGCRVRRFHAQGNIYIRQDTDIGLAVLEVELNAKKPRPKAVTDETRASSRERRQTPGAQVGRLHSTSTPQPSNRAQHNSAHPGPLALHRKPQRNPQTRTPRRDRDSHQMPVTFAEDINNTFCIPRSAVVSDHAVVH